MSFVFWTAHTGVILNLALPICLFWNVMVVSWRTGFALTFKASSSVQICMDAGNGREFLHTLFICLESLRWNPGSATLKENFIELPHLYNSFTLAFWSRQDWNERLHTRVWFWFLGVDVQSIDRVALLKSRYKNESFYLNEGRRLDWNLSKWQQRQTEIKYLGYFQVFQNTVNRQLWLLF